MSIHIEVHELPALRSLDLARWQPQLVCLEVATADGTRGLDTVGHLQAHGHEVALDLGAEPGDAARLTTVLQTRSARTLSTRTTPRRGAKA